MALITLTTDFGVDSSYVAQLKSSVLSIARDAIIVDITHSIAAQDVFHGALILSDAAFYFPVGSVHVAVVDPGVGTNRAIVAAQVDGHWFVAPDNGLLTGVVRGRELTALREVSNRKLWQEPVSSTFHGRDIMAPVAAHLAMGVLPEEIGPSLERIVELPWPVCQSADSKLTGEVVMVDSFGNLITNIFRSELEDWLSGGDGSVEFAGKIIERISRTYGEQPAGELIALLGSGDRLEIAVVSGNAAEHLGVDKGEQVTIRRAD